MALERRSADRRSSRVLRCGIGTAPSINVERGSIGPTGSKYVDRREARFRRQAIPQVDCEADVTGPQRVTTLPERVASLLKLGDGGHRESLCTVEPERIAGPAMEFEERVAVAPGAVTEVRTFRKRARSPSEIAAFQQQSVQRGQREGDVGECRHDAGGAVTVLAQHRGRSAAAGYGSPVCSELRAPG